MQSRYPSLIESVRNAKDCAWVGAFNTGLKSACEMDVKRRENNPMHRGELSRAEDAMKLVGNSNGVRIFL